jgi:hypothetical protein
MASKPRSACASSAGAASGVSWAGNTDEIDGDSVASRWSDSR